MSKYAYLRLCTSGEIKIIEAEETFTLQELQSEVGGGIEIVNCRYGKDLAMVVNDEGLISGLPRNPYASILYGGIYSNAWIAGDAVLCIRRMDPEPDVYPMTREAAEYLRNAMLGANFDIINRTLWR